MKLIASLIVAASLVVGLVAASTSYVVSLDLPSEQLLGQTLNAPFGVIEKNDRASQLIGRVGMRMRRLDDFHRDYELAVEQAKAEGFERDELTSIDPPEDSYRASLEAQGLHLDLAIYDALIAANFRPGSLRNEQRTNLIESSPGQPVAIWKKGTVVDIDTLDAMQAYTDATEYSPWHRDVITIKEFSFARWQHGLWFALAVVGLVAGAVGLRRAGKVAVTPTPGKTGDAATNPRASLEAACRTLESLSERIRHMPDHHARSREIIAVLDTIQADNLQPFVAARPQLLGAIGMGGYAKLMDAFASAERQLNRAWSAAADHVLDEAETCLAEGLARLHVALELVPE